MKTKEEIFLELCPQYKEFNGDQLEEDERFFGFSLGLKEGRKPYIGQVVQIFSDTWYRFNGSTWEEMTVCEQVEWSAKN